MKKAISIFLASAFALGVVGPVRAETRLITAAGITQGTADTIYVNESGDTMTGPLLVPDGSSGAPSVAFASEPGTGWYLSAALRQAWAFDGVGTVMALDPVNGLVIDVNVTLGNAIGDVVTNNTGTWNILNALTANFSSSFTLEVGANTMTINAVTGGLEINAPIVTDGTFEVKGLTGIEFSPGQGVDTVLFSLLVTGAPVIDWLTATNEFRLNKGLRVPGIGIGTTPNAAAVMHVASTTQGSVSAPVMTSAQRDAIGSPIEGLRAFDSTNNVPNYYNGTGWRAVLNVAASSLTVGEIPFAINGSSVDCDSNLFWDNTGKQLGIGTNTPDDSAALDVASTTAGSLPVPRMTTAQRNAIGTPADGLQVDDSDLNALTRYNGSGYDVFSMNIPTIKSGVETSGSFTGNPRTATVTFGTAFPDANYSVTAIGVDGRGWTIDSQVAGSFVINSNASSALTGSVSWTAIAHNDP